MFLYGNVYKHKTHKGLCYRDNLPAVDVKTWYLHAHMFDGDAAAGPVPILFIANPEAAAAAIEAEPAEPVSCCLCTSCPPKLKIY
jgi:hypothetical protein